MEGVSAEARKAARYCMYRKYVGEQWGVVGRGKRIRLAPCVVEITSRSVTRSRAIPLLVWSERRRAGQRLRINIQR